MEGPLLADVDGDGVQETIAVECPDRERGAAGHLFVLDPVGGDMRKFVLLDDFPQGSLYFIDARDLNCDGTLEIIASSPVSAHSDRMYVFRWDGRSYACVGEFTSDAPSIEMTDVDGDGKVEVVVKQRDYAGGPIDRSIARVYKWVAGRYELAQELEGNRGH